MILERLLDFHDTTDQIIPASLKAQRVRWFLDLDEHGDFLGIVETGTKKTEQKELVAPYASRQGTRPPPFLLVDKPDYVLGFVAEKEKFPIEKQRQIQEKADERHVEYVALCRRCAISEKSHAFDALLRFFESNIDAARIEAERLPIKSGDLIAPRVGTQILSDLPGVRQFWESYQDEMAVESSSLIAECLVTGKMGPIARTHPVELLVGPNRVGLVSANENAFLSYGLQQSEIAPMSFTAARKYGEALRYLLENERHRLRVGSVTWIYWTRKDMGGDPLWAIKSAEPAEVENLLRTPRAGRLVAEVTANEFYALAVTANTSRMVVRSWITTTLDDVQRNIRRYFERMRLLDRDGQPHYHKITALAGSLVREFNDLQDHVLPGLLNTALWGRPLPLTLLHQAVQRARAEREHVLTHPRASLIKLVLLSNPNLAEKNPMTDQLNPDHPQAAYQCGRLLALLDDIQYLAVGARATLVDRYYGSASATPASVFGVLMRNAQNHLGKIRKTKAGFAIFFDRQIGEIIRNLDAAGGFPRTLTLEEQGVFALGFYQERNRPKKTDNDAGAQNQS